MANLYRLEATTDALARQFGVETAPEVPVPSPVQPGKQRLIVRRVSGHHSRRADALGDGPLVAAV